MTFWPLGVAPKCLMLTSRRPGCGRHQEIERRLAEDAANPVIFHNAGYGCWHPHVKGYVLQENSIYNRWRLEDVWLDK